MDNNDFTTGSPDSLGIMGGSMEFLEDDLSLTRQRIIVMGLGGCGNNAINYMVRSGLKGPVFIAANSDMQALRPCLAKSKIQLGVKTSAGHGCGGDPEVGRLCAEENLDDLLDAAKGADMAFLMAGLGGGTGSGAIPVLAEALSRLENPPLIVGVVTRPFPWEDCREGLANRVVTQLRRYCNSVIIIPNSKVVELNPDLPFLKAKEKVDEILFRAVSSISYLIESSGVINVDFADVIAVMSKRGSAIMGYGEASGEKRAQLALEAAISNPLMADVSLKGAKGVLVNITGDEEVKSSEIAYINQTVRNQIGAGMAFYGGFVQDDSLAETGSLIVTVVATGLDEDVFAEESLTDFDEYPDEDLLGTDEELSYSDAELADSEFSDQDLSESELREAELVVLEPVVEPQRRVRGEGSGHLAPVSPAPQPVAVVNRSLPLSPTERRTAFPPPAALASGVRTRSKYESNLNVEAAYTRSEYFDVPPNLRGK
ncbi:MAG: cell division FtsZ family protein [Deltaproteobacteria bacterium]|jgi:cell division protein FtsZ|nr:cell division FtsZ family protein [Deltaproteobacteria bacterium]